MPTPLVSITVLAIAGVLVAVFIPLTVFAGGGVGSGGSGGGGSAGGPWGWTTYGHGWAMYSSSGSGPTDGFNTGSWATAKATCQNESAQIAIYILGTGKAPGTSGYPLATGNYMAYDDRGYSGAWGTGGSIDSGRATKISRATAQLRFNQLSTYGVNSAGYTFGSNVGWFCWGFYPNANVTPFVVPTAPTIVRGNPATFTLKRTVTGFHAPNKTAKYSISYRFNNSGPWLNIPTSVTTVYDNTITRPLSMTISGDVSALTINPNLTFSAASIPVSANSICVQMQFVAPVPANISYVGNPDNACIAISNPPPVTTATLAAIAGANTTISVGQTANFTASIDTSNVSSGNADSFTWRVTTSGPSAIGAVANTNTVISGVNSRVTRNISQVINSPGIYCRTIEILASGTPASITPSYAVLAPAAKTQCITVNVVPTIFAGNAQYEKGSGGLVSLPAIVSCAGYIGAVSVNITFNTSTQSVIVSCTAGNQTPAGSVSINSSTENLDAAPVGGLAFMASITSPGSASASGALSIYTVPYARFYGNDVLSQGTLAFNVNGSVAGSGSQYAAIAANLLASATSGVSDGILLNSAQFRGATIPASPDGLKATWDAGGAMPDPHAVASYLPKTVTGTADPGAWPTAVGKYYYNIGGDEHITGLTGTSGKITVHANNIYIDSDITTNNVTGLGFNDTATPVIVLYASQNIFIAPSVQRIDAIIIGGTIHTCNTNGNLASPSPARTAWHTSCANKLTINGSIGADNVIFARTQGTRLKAVANEGSGINGNQLAASAGSIGEAAEIINFPNYLYFASPNLESGTIGATPYQSLFSAPPIL